MVSPHELRKAMTLRKAFGKVVSTFLRRDIFVEGMARGVTSRAGFDDGCIF